MALNDKKYERIFSKTGNDSDKITDAELADIKDRFDNNDYISDKANLSALGPLLYQMQNIVEELDALRTEINNNKDKATFPGFGTSGSTALVGNTTVISSDQAKQITTNNSKITFPFTGLETDGGVTSIAITHTTNEKGDEHALGFTVTIPPAKKDGKTTTKTATLTLK